MNERYTAYGLRGDQDELLRRAVRDGFKSAGLGHAELTQALEWYKDHFRPGMDETALMESFHEFSVAKGWDAEKIVAASSLYSQIRDEGPAAVLVVPTAEEDASLITKADELLKANADAYFRDPELQELVLEARERQLAATPAEPGIDHDAIERRVAQRDVDRFAEMLRKEPGKYWASPELQRQHRDAIAAATREEVPAAVPPMVAPGVAAAPSPPTAAPAAPAPVKVAISDAARRTEIETMMRTDGGKAYWNTPGIQREYNEVLARLGGAPDAPAAAPGTAEAPPVTAERP